jgi:citrate lyase subunit beta / citryl-CoA lyase
MTSRLLRTALYVPAANAKAVTKADSLGADAVILDLEDSVAPDAKAAARAALDALPVTNSCRVIRVNAAGTPWHEDDIGAAVNAAPHALLLPKASSPEDIWSLRRLIMLQRPKAPIAVWAMIETSMGVLNTSGIAAALGPDGVLVLGLNDLAKETGMAQQPGRTPMQQVLTASVIAARAHGAGVLDGVFNAIADDDGFAHECRQGRAFGFDGKSVIHPRQIAPANAVFGPSITEIAEATAIVEAFADPENAMKGVIALSGRMVERLHCDMAKSVLAKAALIEARG